MGITTQYPGQSLNKFITVMERTLFRLFVILLGLSHLISLKAVPVTRTESLMQVPQVHLSLENAHKVTTEENMLLNESNMSERMALELHDYPSSGANNRHTPRGQ
ncbi:putative transmembrane protein [Senna tora]|uniref:Putative transmembrane protein n=1 Tax=Senna tora TaxID=362788 RepID=A0A834SLW9_9FABA|nr:putative transmembrane protein [Senna tora]